MRFLGIRCAIVLVLLAAAGCGADDEPQSLPDASASGVAAVETEPAAARLDADDAPTTTAGVLIIDGDGSGASAETDTSASSTMADAGASTTLPSGLTAGSATTTATTAPPSGQTTAPPSTTISATTTPDTAAPETTAPETTTPGTTAEDSTTSQPTTTEPTTTTEAPTNRPGAFLTVDFQSTPTGTYDDGRIRADWGGSAVRYSTTEGRAAIVDEGGNRFVRIRFPKGKVGPSEAGSQWAVNLGPNAADELFVSYRVRFVGDFDFVRGGKLPGLSGGESNTGGRKPDGSDGWSGRIMWRPQGAAVQYVYHPDQPTIYGDDMSWGQTFPADRWVRVETRIRMNTPGQRNGVVQSWMDGRQVLNRTDIRFRDTNGFQIDRFLFDTFFGGNSPEWAPSKEEHIDFDDFVVSGSPISH